MISAETRGEVMVSIPADVRPTDPVWTDMWADPKLQAVTSIVVLGITLAAVFYLMARFRDYAAKDGRDPLSVPLNFEEMLGRGDITEAEYRKIMAKSRGDSISARPDRPTLQ
jgi:hypothetical protein